MKLLVRKLTDSAHLPTYGSDYAAGLDLYSDSDYIIEPNTRLCVSTGIAIEWVGEQIFNNDVQNLKFDENPQDYYLRIAPRSGLAFKYGIDVGAGVIDYDYRGEIKVILFNHGQENFIINKGDRIGQAILTKIIRFSTIILSSNLSDTNRGNQGFGSTGSK